MISVQEAYQYIKHSVKVTSQKVEIPLSQVLGHTLATSVCSPIDMPPFDQSAMDGYAIKVHHQNEYDVIAEVQAGAAGNPILEAGEAARIFTGAGVPDSADTIVMQEQVRVFGQKIELQHNPKIGDHIRKTGEQIAKGAVALQEGTKLTPAAIGFLKGLGVEKVNVYQKPSIGIITTGDELVPTGQTLQRGEIYESNGLMLEKILHQLHYNQTSVYKAKDTLEATRLVLRNAMEKHDVVLVTGGISVGAYDHVKEALQQEGVKEIFYKVKQKPGKPLFFGTQEDKLIFALPGNPAAALSCFYVYVHQALEWLTGYTSFERTKFRVKNKFSYQKKGDRAQFLKAFLDDDGVTILGTQSSAMLKSFAVTNCLAYVPEEVFEVKAQDLIEIILLPQI